MDGDLAATLQARQRSLADPARANRRNSRRLPGSCFALSGIARRLLAAPLVADPGGLVCPIKEIRRGHRIQAKLIVRFHFCSDKSGRSSCSYLLHMRARGSNPNSR
jgi:hypothetical protein